ncbi:MULTISPECIES: protein translocase subunit SecF [unclassified Kitasatospora]|uniref:protein translocase subunit SecF n=1 Tax=unclassified Kitasatospora TaxID=2633591 RepID=UPI0007091812|nr:MULTISPECIES: protein translocase subunit SecF [unclassified Kitasatospora]KQV22815.1 preprotein translocase subunit SecF [Kitasatospora sp. Root107]KRB61674.1 preprotein translocase subunit SecF [Kitasatospora sp. Root187]
MSRFSNLGHRLYQGEVSFDFVGRRKLWYSLSALIVLVAGIGLAFGLKLGIEFEGGSVYTITKPGLTVSQAQSAADDILKDTSALVQSTDKGAIKIQVSAEEQLPAATFITELSKDLAIPANDINAQVVGPSWGEEISKKALLGLVIFMVLVTIYLAIAFEWRMAIAALVALIHDLLITIGVYALVGFEVTPGTVIGFLTILGYSLYDTVVVFDTVKENAKGITRQNKRTFSEAANAGLNQTLVRSINTTVVALLPVAALLFIGGGLLGAGTLNDISLALFIGLAAGAYSSICVATPLYAQLKEMQPEMKALAKKVEARRAADAKAEAERAASGEADPSEDDQDEDGAAGIVGNRNQPVSRSRSKGRPSGKH